MFVAKCDEVVEVKEDEVDRFSEMREKHCQCVSNFRQSNLKEIKHFVDIL
jgi:hypothetical protein